MYETLGLKSIETINKQEFKKMSDRIRTNKINPRIVEYFQKSSIKEDRYIMNHIKIKFSYHNEITKCANNYP